MSCQEIIIRLKYAIIHMEGEPTKRDLTEAWSTITTLINKLEGKQG